MFARLQYPTSNTTPLRKAATLLPTVVYTLEADEYAAALMLAGAIELALGLLVSTDADAFNGDDIAPRLTAGAASLASRGLADADGQSLSPELAPLIETVARPDYTLYLRKVVGGDDEGLAFHFRGDAIIAQRIDPSASHTLMALDALDSATRLTVGFFGIAAAAPAADAFSLPATEYARLNAAETPEQRSAALAAASGIENVHAAFAADYREDALRGGFLRIDYGHGHPTTRAGATVIGGLQRLWIARMEAPGSVRVVPAAAETVSAELERLQSLNP